MRKKKALINASVSILAFIITFIPNLITRKIFLQVLGDDLLGLNSLYTNIIGWLSIFELGVGTAIIFSLYKPFAEDNKKLVKSYIRFYGKFYRRIGIIILFIGLLITPYLKYFINGNIDLNIVKLGFIIFLINSFISYLFSSRLSILNVAQEFYKVNIGVTASKLMILFIQFLILKTYPSFILYILTQLVINLIYFIIINLYIIKKYPWIKGKGEDLEKNEKTSLLKNIKAMFMHKIGSLIVFSTDNIIISKFIGLATLANYTNYNIVITAFQTIISKGMEGVTSSIGNLLTEDNKSRFSEIHKNMFFLNFWITSFIVISLYNTLNQFIGIWVGKEYLLDSLTFNVLLVNLYLTLMRGSIEKFKEGSGNFYRDRYAPIFEAVINLISSILLVKHIGIAGVFIGTLISNVTIIFWVQPYMVYKYVFEERLVNYFKIYFKYLVIGLIILVFTEILVIPYKYIFTLRSFILNCILNIAIINSLYLIIFFRTNEFKYFKTIFNNLLMKYTSSKTKNKK